MEAGGGRGYSSSMALPSIPACPFERRELLRHCLRWTRGDLSEAEDLLGDACLRVVEATRRGDANPNSPASFWVTVINNLGRDRLRRARRWRFDCGEEGWDTLLALFAPASDTEERVCQRELLEAAVRELQQLNVKQRAALLLRSRGVEYPRIGELLDTSSANARKLVETARNALARKAA
jgi:RNA polymerase sigma factor (sigma-70 family)